MVKAERVVLQFLVIIFIRINVNVSHLRENTYDIISRILNARSQPSYASPVILIIADKSSKYQNLLRTSDHHVLTGGGKMKIPDDTVDDEKTKKYVKEIFRSAGDNNDPIVQETNYKFENALRARCTMKLDCEINCEKKKEKKQDKCKKSCKDVYDYLMLCKPPGGKGQKKEKKKKDSCEDSRDDSCEPKKKKKKKDPCANSCDQSDNDCVMQCEIVEKGKGRTMPPTWRF